MLDKSCIFVLKYQPSKFIITMPNGKGPDKLDDDKLRPTVIEETGEDAATNKFGKKSNTGTDYVKLDQLKFEEEVQQVMTTGSDRHAAEKIVYNRRNTRRSRNNIKTNKLTGGRIEVHQAIENDRKEAQKRDLITTLAPLNDNDDRSLKPKLRLESHFLYKNMGPWLEVSESEEYRGVKLDKEMILASINEIVRTVWHRHAKDLRIVELGPGTGDKIKDIIIKLLNQMRLGKYTNLGPNKLKHIDLDIVDVSEAMLHLTFISILRTIKNQLNKMQANQLGEDHPWKEFVEFIELHEKEFTSSEDFANLKMDKSFYAFISDKLKRHNGEPVENILRYALARYFGFKKTDTELLDWLDNELELPLDIRPRSATFQSLDGQRFHSTKEQASMISHFGDEIGNKFPGITIEEEYAGNLLGQATPFNKRQHEAEVKDGRVDESSINATYILYSFQTGTLDHPNATPEEIQADAKRIMPAYDNDEFNHFVSHLFKNPELSTFSDPVTGEAYIDHTDCYDVVANYGEDPDNPGYYGTTHHLVFNRDLDISITISYIEDKMIKEETKTFKAKKGQEVFLLPSYKPTAAQMEQLCEKNDIKVVDVYQDYEGTNAVFLIRAKTDFEKVWDQKRREKEEETANQASEIKVGSPTVHTTTAQIRDRFGRFTGKKQICA